MTTILRAYRNVVAGVALSTEEKLATDEVWNSPHPAPPIRSTDEERLGFMYLMKPELVHATDKLVMQWAAALDLPETLAWRVFDLYVGMATEAADHLTPDDLPEMH